MGVPAIEPRTRDLPEWEREKKVSLDGNRAYILFIITSGLMGASQQMVIHCVQPTVQETAAAIATRSNNSLPSFSRVGQLFRVPVPQWI